jgi:hypothetical protein
MLELPFESRISISGRKLIALDLYDLREIHISIVLSSGKGQTVDFIQEAVDV